VAAFTETEIEAGMHPDADVRKTQMPKAQRSRRNKIASEEAEEKSG